MPYSRHDRLTDSELLQLVEANFDKVFLRGIPGLLTDAGAFLSFICTFAGAEALAGFFSPEDDSPGARFKTFARRYFPPEYAPLVEDLWKLRNALVHAASPGPLGLAHNQPKAHLRMAEGRLVLNAEDFYEALVGAARLYFDSVRRDAALLASLVKRCADPRTGVSAVKVVSLA